MRCGGVTSSIGLGRFDMQWIGFEGWDAMNCIGLTSRTDMKWDEMK